MHPSSAAGYAGAIQGDFCVDQNGNAVYTIAVQVPPGTADLAPSLAFVYHSAISNGMLGAGWSLQGLSSILRTGKNPAQDGVSIKQPVRYTADDRLILDGQRLVSVAGAYGAPSAVYHTEVQTWRKVTARGSGFVSLSGNGTRHEFGLTADSLIGTGAAGSPARAWALSRVVDSCGNYATFAYRRDPQTSAYYPDRIDFTGNEGLAPTRSVRFVYEKRPDLQPRYEGGVAVHETQLLTQVKTFVAERLVLTYTLDYQTGKASGRSQLRQIKLSDATGKSLPPTRFDWLDMDNPMFGRGRSVAGPDVKGGAEVIPLDVEGTGRRDLLFAGANDRRQLAVTLMVARADGFEPPVKQTLEDLAYSPGCILPLDVDGDGATELIHVGQANNKLQLTLVGATKQDGHWRFAAGPRGAAGPSNLRAGGRVVPLDLNGDGRIDLAYCWADDAGKLRIQTLLSTGTGFAPAEVTETDLPFGPANQIVAADVNGDGVTDLLYARSVIRGGSSFLALRALISNGRRFELQEGDPLPPSANLPFGGALIPARLSDGDQDDLVYGYQDGRQNLSLRALFGTGRGYEPAAGPMDTGIHYTGLLMPMAMRGAGLTELAVSGRDDAGKLRLYMLRWSGTAFGPPEICIQPEDRARPAGRITFPADVAGTGKTDLLHVTSNSAGNLEIALLPAPPVVPDRVHRITDGLNASYSIDYLSLTNPSVYSKDDLSTKGLLEGSAIVNASVGGAAWPLQVGVGLSTSTTGAAYALPTRQFAEYVVASYTVSDGRNHNYRREYRYRGCRVDPAGRGWLGFSSREARETDAQTVKTEHFSQTFPSISSITETTVRQTPDLSLLSRERFTYQSKAEHGVHTNHLTITNGERFTAGKAHPDYVEKETRVYDAFGHVTRSAVERSHGSPRYIISQYTNDAAEWRLGDLTSRITSADAESKKILSHEQFVVDPRTRRPAASSSWDDRHQRWLTVKRQYDRYGNEVSAADETGATSKVEFDSVFHTFPIRTTLPATGGVALFARSEYDPNFGEKLVEIDVNGVRKEQTLDGLGRVVLVKGPDQENRLVAMLETRWGVDETHGYYAEQRKRTGWSDDAWHWSRRYVDGLGREHRAAVMSADGRGEIITRRSFDSAGNITRESLPHLATETPRWIERSYDHAGRLTRTVEPSDAGSRTVEIAYPNVNHEVVTDSVTGSTDAPRVSEREFAFFGDTRSIIRSFDPSRAVSLFEYDALGRIVRATDPALVVTTSVYDTLGRRVELRVANETRTFSSEKVEHDDLHGKVTVTTNKGNVIVLEHDARSRLVRRTVTPPNGPAAVTQYEHDRAEGITGTYTADRLARVRTSEGVVYGYSYDPGGNLVTEDVLIADRQHTIRKTYSPEGGVATLTWPDGATLHKSYTRAGQLASVALTEGGARTELAAYTGFDARGRATEIVYGNGVRERHEYNTLGQLKSLAIVGKDATAPLAHTAFVWDGFHSLSRVTDRVNPRHSQAFSYDSGGRLTQSVRNADGGQTQWEVRNFAYDGAGNLKSKNGIQYSYEGHQVVEGKKEGLRVFSATYDADGVMQQVERGGRKDRYEADALGRIASSAGAKFTYDDNGRRVAKQSKDATTYYVSPELEVVVFGNGATQTTKYVYGASSLIAQITHRTPGELLQAPLLDGVPSPGVGYFHSNLINSTSVQTDSGGTVTATIEYEPFGEIYSRTGGDHFRWKFSGKELDQETGLYYFESRYYDPVLGRFISSDDRLGAGYGQPDAQNRYAYVLNNPVNRIDPTGHLSGWALFASIVIVVAAIAVIAASTVVTGGLATAALGVLGSTLLSAGLSGGIYTATAGDNFNWKDWAFETGVGAATGAVSGAFSGVGGVLAKQAALSFGAAAAKSLGVKLLQVGIMTAFGTVGGGVAGLTGNRIRNDAAGRSANEGWPGAFTRGLAIGAVTGVVSGVGQAWLKPAFKVWASTNEYTTKTFLGLAATSTAIGAVFVGAAHMEPPHDDTAGDNKTNESKQEQMRLTNLGYTGPGRRYAMA